MKQATRRAPRPLGAPVGSMQQKLRRICTGCKAAEESLSFGPRAFRVRGTPFAVRDWYRDGDCLWPKVPPAERAAPFATWGWFAAPYGPRRTAPCARLEAIDWRRIRPPHDRIPCALAAASRARTRRGAGR
jgi:hypothetical protein